MGILSVANVSAVQSPGFEIPGVELRSVRQQAAVSQQIRRATRDVEALISGRNTDDLLTRLQPGSWCVVECLDHLTQTTRVFLPAISESIAGAPRLSTNRPLRTGILPSLFIRNLNPPYRIRLKVLPQLTPQNPSLETAWTDFLNTQRQLLAALNSAAGFAIDKVRVKSPIYARISYNVYGAFRMLAAHQSRHIWQIEQILKGVDHRKVAGTA